MLLFGPSDHFLGLILCTVTCRYRYLQISAFGFFGDLRGMSEEVTFGRFSQIDLKTVVLEKKGEKSILINSKKAANGIETPSFSSLTDITALFCHK